MLLYSHHLNSQDGNFVIDLQKPLPLAFNIGRASLSFEADSMEALAERIQNEPELQAIKNDDVDIDNPTIALIQIAGPFQHLPPGVVLVDTPGLGDADVVKSFKTLELLDSAQVLWFVSPAAYQLAREWDKQILLKAKQLGKLIKEWHIVVTKADVETQRSDEHVKAYRNKMLKYSFEDFIKSNSAHRHVNNFVFDQMKERHSVEYENLEVEVDKSSIHFFTNQPGLCERDCKPWRDMLLHYGQQYHELLVDQMTLVKGLTHKFEQNGWGQTSLGTLRSMEKKFENSLKALKAAIASCLGDNKNVQAMINAIIKQWNDYGAQSNTKRAIMNPQRAGEFIGRRMNTRVRYDLNEVVATQWMSRIQPAWNLFLGEVHNIQGSLCSISGSGVLASNFHEQIMELGRKVFEVEVKSILRGLLIQNSVYSVGRNKFPEIGELQVVFDEQFRLEIDATVGSARQKGSFQQTMEIIVDNISARSVPVHPGISSIMKGLRAEVQNVAELEDIAPIIESSPALPSMSSPTSSTSRKTKMRDGSCDIESPHGKKARSDDDKKPG
jgi:hypothetical protein